nr:PREDICTED: zona pellucida sperm-binding protein 3-like [Latimeria chalumnae]|eukprot:XP_014351605.1 PREDICTED: zona pellucida sperm-binding protein 3-like [Latimeria chalumnae]
MGWVAGLWLLGVVGLIVFEAVYCSDSGSWFPSGSWRQRAESRVGSVPLDQLHSPMGFVGSLPGVGIELFQGSPEFKAVSRLRTVTVECEEAWMVVTVKKDLFGTGFLAKAVDLTLGPQKCSFFKEDGLAAAVVFQVGLHECGNVLEVRFYYTEIVRIFILLSFKAEEDFKNHPTWIPFTSTVSVEERLAFSLHLMNDDFSKVRESNIYYLGDVLHIEASVIAANHMPLLLFIDSCVATLTPDKDSSLRYPIIDYHGCLIDGRSEDSSSVFRPPRPSFNKLRFNLDAFRFYQDSRTVIYITCHLKVTAMDRTPDSMNKACSFRKPANEWTPMEGKAATCSCCETKDCGNAPNWRSRWGRDVASKLGMPGLKLEGDMVVGPLVILDAKSKGADHSDSSVGLYNELQSEAGALGSEESPMVLIVLGVVAAILLSCVVLGLFKIYRQRSKLQPARETVPKQDDSS